MEIRQIEIKQISVDPDQPRKHHSEESLQGLSDSIRQHGMLNPITVSSSNDGRFRIVTGERRYRAATMARLDSVPCIIKEVAPDERLTEQLIENLQREDLQPLEKAKAIMHAKGTLNLTNREVAKRLGLSERAVGYLLDLIELPDEIGEQVVSSPNRPSDGQVTEKHARFLKQLNDDPELQSAVVDKIRDKKLNTEDTGNLVKALKKRPEKADEILGSASDHLAKFFQNDDTSPFLEDYEDGKEPMRITPSATKIMDFLPALANMELRQLPMPEVRQIEDALTSLSLAVDGLLKRCKSRLEGMD